MTQLELADKLNVSSKTISKWETNRGLPDISIINSLAEVLKISIIELFNGEQIINKNISNNLINSKIYVCPICGNIIHSLGESVISCCGISLPYLISEDGKNMMNVEKVEDEYYINIEHEMTKTHYISFIAYVTTNDLEIIKFYPESIAEARFKIKGHGYIYAYCNKDGLYKIKI